MVGKIQKCLVKIASTSFCLILFCFTAFNAELCGQGATFTGQESQNWTWSYTKFFSAQECLQNSNLPQISFFKENVKNFSQLIFSWNSIRPKAGGFSFYIQTRNAANKNWSRWHKMFDWGSNFQQSYFSTNEDSQYVYVRLETGLNSMADAFRISIKSYGGADLGLVKSVCACTSNFNKFKYEIVDKNLLALKSVYIRNVPRISQRLVDHKECARICSPTSCSMLSGFLSKSAVNTFDFAENVFDPALGDIGSYGNWSFNVAELYCKCNHQVCFYVQRLNSFLDLYNKLMCGCPVVVSVRGKLDGGQKVYNNGHLIVVVGWDCASRSVICHDPAFYTNSSTLVRYRLDTFLRGWEGSNRLAYVANLKK